jgi:hypothetical protein
MGTNYNPQTFLLPLRQAVSQARAVDDERIQAGQRIAPAIFQLLQQAANSSENTMQLDYDEKADPAFCRLRWVDPPPERSLEVRISRSAIHLALLDQNGTPRPGSPLRVDTRSFTLDQLEGLVLELADQERWID